MLDSFQSALKLYLRSLGHLGAHALLPLSFLILVVLPMAAQPSAASEVSVVERAIEFHGGKAYASSETRLQICSKSGCFRLRSRVDDQRFDHTVEGKVRGGERKVRITNEEVWLWENGAPREIRPEDSQVLRDWVMARVYFPFLPYRLLDPSAKRRDLGQEIWDGKAVHKVKVTFAAGSSTDAADEYLYWFDPETARLEQFAYSYEGNPGGLRLRRAQNHRRIGGMLFSDQENLGVEGPDLTVDSITPTFVKKKMRSISRVELRDIQVTSLP